MVDFMLFSKKNAIFFIITLNSKYFFCIFKIICWYDIKDKQCYVSIKVYLNCHVSCHMDIIKKNECVNQHFC